MRALRGRGLLLGSSSLALALIAGCASTQSAEQRPPPSSADASAPAADGAPPGDAPPAPESVADEGAAVDKPPPKDIEPLIEAKPADAAGQKAALSADGIDDETPLPDKGPAREAFDRAVVEARQNPASAARLFVEAAGKTTYFYAALYNAGAAYERAGDDQNAERYYREALKVRPDYGYALTNLYLLLARTGRQGEADRVIDDALRSHGDRAGPHVAAAVRAYGKRDLATVETEALRAIRIDERQVTAMRLMAQVFYEQARYGSARFALENALVLQPGNALLHLMHGHVLVKLEEEKKALEAYGKAVQLRPELAEAQESYAVLLKRNGDPERALSAFQKVAELRPTSAFAQLHLGNGYRAVKRYVEAEAAYKKALELDPGLHAAHFNLGIMYLDNPIEGRDELEQLKAAEQELKLYADTGKPSAREKARLAEYLETTETLIRRLEKRREREQRQKLIKEAEEAEKRAQEAAAAGADGAPADGEAAPADGAAPEANDAPEADAAPAGAGDATGAPTEDAK